MIAVEEGVQVRLVSPNEVARDVRMCKRQTLLGPDALSQVHLPACEGGV